MRLSLTYAAGALSTQFRDKYRPVAVAATEAITRAGEDAKVGGRASIAAGGFSRRWQNALRLKIYPEGKRVAVNAAAWLFHKIPYAHVFERGMAILGRPMLWLPLAGAPKKIGRRRVTPGLLSSRGVKLITMNAGSRHPLLAARVRMSRAKARQSRPKVSLAQLTASGNSERGRGRGVLRTIPLFFGLSSVTIRKRFDVLGAVRKAKSRLAGYFTAAMGKQGD